jgi:hypothetical protein
MCYIYVTFLAMVHPGNGYSNMAATYMTNIGIAKSFTKKFRAWEQRINLNYYLLSKRLPNVVVILPNVQGRWQN